MDPKILTYLSDVSGMNTAEAAVNDTLMRMYMSGLVEAKWEGGKPMFSISMLGEKEYMLAYAHEQKIIQE